MTTEIDDRACFWAARLDKGPLSTADQQQLDAWLAVDKRHLGAFARARAVSVHFDRARALGPDFDHAQFRAGAGSSFFRRHVRSLSAVAGIAAAAILAGLLYSPAEQFSTRRGEIRLVPLNDGSAITLNTATQLTVDYAKAERQVFLIQGEALFTVAKDSTRPFVVRAGDTRVRAVGTSFAVRHLQGEDVKVVVREGVVEVTQTGAGASQPLRVAANTLAYVSPGNAPAPVPLPAAEVSRQLAWQQGMISLDGMTLRDAAREFARYNSIRIVIEDPEVAGRTVTGLFSANNPIGFAQAVASSMDLKAEVASDSVRILH